MEGVGVGMAVEEEEEGDDEGWAALTGSEVDGHLRITFAPSSPHSSATKVNRGDRQLRRLGGLRRRIQRMA